MSAAKTAPKTLIEAVQAVFDALEPFDEEGRTRIIQSAASLLGAALPLLAVGPSSRPSSTIPLTSPIRNPERPLSPVELLAEKQPATNAQRIALFAYYRERVEGLSRFSKDDIRPYFSKAKQPQPQNFDRDFGNAVSLGWIYEDASDSYLTSKGLEAVEAGFGGKSLPRGGAAPRKKVPKKSRREKKR